MVSALLFAGGCGADKDEPVSSGADDAATIAEAEQAVREELPDNPYWKGAKFKGVLVSDTEVCVNRTLTKETADLFGFRRASHVVVAVPDMTTGEPLDGPCGTTPPDPAAKANRFFIAMDGLAIELDDAVSAAQDGDEAAVRQITRLGDQIKNRNDAWTLRYGEISVGANLLHSAATTALIAARAGDVAELADQRSEISDAREKLAQEALD